MTDEVTQRVPGVTDSSGAYHLQIKHNHDDEICEVALQKSPRNDCDEMKAGTVRDRIALAHDNGISSDVRFANTLRFLKRDPLAACGQLLQMSALSDDLD